MSGGSDALYYERRARAERSRAALADNPAAASAHARLAQAYAERVEAARASPPEVVDVAAELSTGPEPARPLPQPKD